MPLIAVDSSQLWNEYRTHLVHEARKVRQYAMSRNKWQRYFQHLTELERSRNISCLRTQVSDTVYHSLVKATERFEAQPTWLRWVLLAFTSVGRKVSLYHYLCFEEKLQSLSEKSEPDLTAITELETTLLRASNRLSGGSRTRVMLQRFWDGIRQKTEAIKRQVFGITPSLPVKKGKIKKQSNSATSLISSEEQEQILNATEVQDMRQRCQHVVPDSEPFASADQSVMVPYQDPLQKAHIVPITTTVMLSNPSHELDQAGARYTLLKMIIYRESAKIQRIFLEAAKKCAEVAPLQWESISEAAKREAHNKSQELLGYLAPSKHVEACLRFKSEVIAELERLHTQKDGAKTIFNVEAELALLGYEQDRGINVLPELATEAQIQLTHSYQKYLRAWEEAIRSQDISTMQTCALTLALLQQQQETLEIMTETTFISYYSLLSDERYYQKILAYQGQIIMQQDQILTQQDQLLRLGGEQIELLSEQNQFLRESIEANAPRIVAIQSGIDELEERMAKLEKGIALAAASNKQITAPAALTLWRPLSSFPEPEIADTANKLEVLSCHLSP